MNIAIAGPGLMGSRSAPSTRSAVTTSPSLPVTSIEASTASTPRSMLPRRSSCGPPRRSQPTTASSSCRSSPISTPTPILSRIDHRRGRGEDRDSQGRRRPHAKRDLASNTSSLSIGRLGGWAGASKRMLGTHYWNPPLLMPLVEVVAGPETGPALIEQVMELLRELGKRPVAVERDVDGFVWNRLQLALLRRRSGSSSRKVASPEVVDEIVRDGLARRWRYTGPFATAAALGGPRRPSPRSPITSGPNSRMPTSCTISPAG